MANATVTVESSGGDYTTLNSALSTEAADLTSNCHSTGSAGILTIQCGNFGDTTTASTGTGYTTSSSYYINIVGDPADKTSSTTGKWSTSRYRLTGGAYAPEALFIRENYTRITDLQVRSNASLDSGSRVVTLDCSFCQIVSTIISSGSTTRSSHYGIGNDWNDGDGHIIRNCILYDFAGSSSYAIYLASETNTNTIYLQNNTIHNCASGFYAARTAIATNNLVSAVVAATGTYYASGTDYNATTDATFDYTVSGGPPTHDRVSQTFTFVDEANDDFHLAAGDSGARDCGTDLSGTFTTDIDGETRPTGSGTWDIGADEVPPSGRPLPHRLFGGPLVGPFRGAFAC
jgi:hypothetical protein